MTTGRTLPMPPPGGDDPIDALIAECLARLSQGDADPLGAVCAQHPEHAAELRRRHAGLAALGLWGGGEARSADRIGNFQLLRELGRGGMGVVWLAHQERPLRRLAAVKVIGGRASLNVLARFEAERQTLAMLVHANIAQVLEAGRTDDGQPWYAMEFVDGVPLTAYCAKHRASIDQRLELFLQLCEAVQFAHQQGVLHRDLKPGNVLVCERLGRPVVKVIDFGLAKALQEPFAEQRDLTEFGQILGTPEYMSPEQAMPTAAGVDTRTDVYALGTILYELCTGMLPFDFVELRRRGFPALQRAVCEQEVPPPSVRLRGEPASATTVAGSAATTPSQLLRRLRGDLDWITGKAMAKERERRYATVAEFAADVRRHLGHQPVLAGPPSAVYVLRKFVRRHRVGVAVAATALVGLVVSLWVALDLLGQRDESLSRFDSLQVALDLARLEQEAAQLWPARPERVPAFDAWLAAARRLLEQEAGLQRQFIELQQGGTSDGRRRLVLPREQFLHAQLQTILAGLGPEGRLQQLVADVAARREWAASLRQRTIDATAAAAVWQQAIETIADPTKSPAYVGLRITPQLGFLPLGQDESSKLFEFAFLQPGEKLPERKEKRWLVGADTCMVFVLVPGGAAHLGFDWPDDRLPEALRPHDTEYVLAEGGEFTGIRIPVVLRPYLLSKYEVTRGQWSRATGERQLAGNDAIERRLGITAAHPAIAVDFHGAQRMAMRTGLMLPTVAQWQHAARAGAEAPWWTGFDATAWRHHENLGDRSYAELGKLSDGDEPDRDFDDGFPFTAPVEALSANPFGFHHMLGNVREITRDAGYKFQVAMPRAGDGLMEPQAGREGASDYCDVMGGSYATSWLKARSTLRTRAPKVQAAATYGLRLVHQLQDGG